MNPTDFNEEFDKISDYFLLDKKTKKVLNYKAMNELLDKAFEDLYGLDEYAKEETDFKERMIPILGLFISGAARIEDEAKKKVLDAVPKKMKDYLTEPLIDINQANKETVEPTVQETNKKQLSEAIKDKLERLAGKTDSTSKTNNTRLDTDSKEKSDDTFRETPVENKPEEPIVLSNDKSTQTEFAQQQENGNVEYSSEQSDKFQSLYVYSSITGSKIQEEPNLDATTVTTAEQYVKDQDLVSDPKENGMPF